MIESRAVRRLGTLVGAIGFSIWAAWTLQPAPTQTSVLGWPEWTLADGLRNLALTALLGVGLALRGHSVWRVALVGTALAGAIETAQWFVPGRDADLLDVLANGLGAAIGSVVVVTVVAAGRLSDRAAGARVLAAALGLVAWVVFAAAALSPHFPDTVVDPAWTPELGWLSTPRSQVLEASLGGVAIPPSAPAAASAALVAALQRGEVARARWQFAPEAANPPAPLVRLNDVRGELWLLAVAGRDLVWQWQVRGRAWGLEQPAWRWPGALDGVREDAVVDLQWRIDGAGLEAVLDGETSWRRRLSLAHSWCLAWPTRLGPRRGAATPWLDAGWLALLWLPVGLHARRNGWTAAGLGLGAAALLAGPWLGLAAPTAGTAASATAGLGLGVGLGHPRFRGRPGPEPGVDQNSV
ncbi:MAG: VanZ family protein [Myxococcota bacterium]